MERPLEAELCTCCLHTEHVKDKTGLPWVWVVAERKNCRRCGKPCQNERCAELPANPDGRGYGRVPRRRSRL